ncbi:unnamed protein product (macronuclear) [Paramecium tetraurelia]|uniref:Uncharacterized protein n=1 Tax=Paramecium tetraurelia TaxID=5888 RepID=A0DPU4_PARTE|nr:uncharacterized protein GSPATT00039712001 [Paramecium tetraurelia]CAK85061.1 unnamed protein product [Paramecium tetraurelia]|eukprot:XP_001452458.1 hypothetical protein (macronuclear) [Paramecium tetraurelia strain d4-2]
MFLEVKFPCGRYDFNQDTKKVVIVKAKGLLNLYLNEENELWLKWYNVDLDNKLEIVLKQFKVNQERVLIKGCTFFEKVKGQNRVYLLRFTDDDYKYFFWMQSDDPSLDENYCKQFNNVINAQVLDDPMEIEQQPPVQTITQQQSHPQPPQQMDLQQQQLLQLLQQQLTSRIGPGLSLTDLLTTEFLTQIAKDQEYFEALKEQEILFIRDTYLPDQQNLEQFRENLLSPQFKQALDQLTHALKGRERSSVIQQLDLDYRILEQEFDGVIAFVKAIIRKAQNKN